VQARTLYLDSPTYLAASGWDWMPAVRDRASGIWNHVRLRSSRARRDRRPARRHEAAPARTYRRGHRHRPGPQRRRDRRPSGDGPRGLRTDHGRADGDGAGGATTEVVRPGRPPGAAGQEPEAVVAQRVRRSRTCTTSRSPRWSRGKVSDRADHAVRHPPVRLRGPAGGDLPAGEAAAGPSATQGHPDRHLRPQHKRYVRIQAGARATGWGISLWSLSVPTARPAPTWPCTRPRPPPPTTAARRQPSPTATPHPLVVLGVRGRPVDPGRSRRGQGLRPGHPALGAAYALDFVVQVSDDGSAWTDVKAVRQRDPAGNTGTQTVDFARADRPLRADPGRQAGHQLGHLDVDARVRRRPRPAPTWPCGKTATASTEDGNPARQCRRRQPAHPVGPRLSGQPVDPGRPGRAGRVRPGRDRLGAGVRPGLRHPGLAGRPGVDRREVGRNTPTELKISVNGVRVFCPRRQLGLGRAAAPHEPDRTRETVRCTAT
jgi:hypothetical protein